MIAPDNPLLHIRKDSDHWRELVRWCENQIRKYREELESEATPLDRVQSLRAKIASMKLLMKSNEEDNRDVQY